MSFDSLIWPTNVDEAIRIQHDLRSRLIIAPNPTPFKTIAGIDVSHKDNLSHAAIVVLDAQTMEPITSVRVSAPTRFPYITGLLSFREIPVILQALQQLDNQPDVLMVDGQGIAHPRRLGIAAHLGVLLDLPAVGVGKSRLTGRFVEPAFTKGSVTPLMAGTEQIGTVLRSKDKCRPLFISPGHRLSQDHALHLTLRYLTKYRLPEPTRLADKLSKQR